MNIKKGKARPEQNLIQSIEKHLLRKFQFKVTTKKTSFR